MIFKDKEKEQLSSDPAPAKNSDNIESDTVIDEIKPQSANDPVTGTDFTTVASTTNHNSEDTENSIDDLPPTKNPQTVSKVPNHLTLDIGGTENRGGVTVDPTGSLSPTSYSTFKDFLNHTPDLNLPWQSMRSVSQCGCGMPFSYSRRKVRKSIKSKFLQYLKDYSGKI